MKISALILAASAAVLASAQNNTAGMLSYGTPVVGTTWDSGKTAPVTWSNDCADSNSTNKTFPISLNRQQGQFQVPLNIPPIGFLDCSEPGTTTVQVPAVPSGAGYSILVTIGGIQSYSALFTIRSNITDPNANVTSPTITLTTTTLATPTANATANATSSLPTVSVSPTPKSAAGSLQARSTVALAVLAAAAGLML